jgi:hypothetical protein
VFVVRWVDRLGRNYEDVMRHHPRVHATWRDHQNGDQQLHL